MHMQSYNDQKKYRFFDPFTGEAPLKYVTFVLTPRNQKHGFFAILSCDMLEKNVGLRALNYSDA